MTPRTVHGLVRAVTGSELAPIVVFIGGGIDIRAHRKRDRLFTVFHIVYCQYQGNSNRSTRMKANDNEMQSSSGRQRRIYEDDQIFRKRRESESRWDNKMHP